MSLQSDFRNVIDILVNPKKAIDYIHGNPSHFVPVMLIVLLHFCWFFALLVYVIDPIAEAVMASVVPLGPTAWTIIRSILIPLIFIFDIALLYTWLLVLAGYLSLVTPDSETSIRFRQWFSLSTWAHLPQVIWAISGILLLVIYPLELAEWLRPEDLLSGNPWDFWSSEETGYFIIISWLLYFLFLLWTLGIFTIGYHKWTNRSFWTSGLIVSIPYLVIGALYLLLFVWVPFASPL